MFSSEMYQLLDFGDGRRLERFGALVLDRPCPAAEKFAQADGRLWEEVDARFEWREERYGSWVANRRLPERWHVSHGPIMFELKLTEFGHVGLFPEQAANWDWLVERLKESDRPLKVLNLFAYTGGSTLAAAAAGAEVTHVDAARNVVAWARRNAELSGMADAPIRWVVEDAMKFVRREVKRQNHYDALILDPPSYGHGRRGEVWRLSKHLPRLLEICGQLTAGWRRFVLLTCHTPKFTPKRLKHVLQDALGDTDPGSVNAEQLAVPTATGRKLPSGVAARWQAEAECTD